MEKYTFSFFSSKTKVKPEVVDLDIDSIKKKLTEYAKLTKITKKDSCVDFKMAK